MRKIYVIGKDKFYANWMQGELTDNIKEADLVVFTGGEDVSPDLYRLPQDKHPKTFSNRKRDQIEITAYYNAVDLNKPLVGICRGGQLLCSLQKNGILIQHQQNPLYIHSMKTFDDRVINVSSTHHQAQYPFKMNPKEYRILGWTEGLSDFHEGGNQEELNPKVECEVVYYPRVKALAIQSHPEEMIERDEESTKWFQELLNKHLNNEL